MAAKFWLVLVALIFISGQVFSLSCGQPAHRHMVVPAVNDLGRGQIVNISLELKGGDGTTYIATHPIVGGMTQASGSTAMALATSMTGYNSGTCDALFKIGTGELESIDGPSAGAAMTLLLLSALKNETLPSNFTITGTIESNGVVGLVGGIPEKASAASSAGIALFLVPTLGFEERLILGAISKNTNMKIVQVSNITQAEDLAIGKSVDFSNPALARQVPPQVNSTKSLASERFSVFRNVARNMVEKSRGVVNSISQSSDEYGGFLQGELDVAENAFSRGYIYTGANTAFLAGINADFLTSSGSSRETIEARAKKVEECYKSTFDIEMNEGNWEWVIGGQLRASWAKKKLSGIGNQSYGSDIQTLGTLRDVIYAEKWCEAAKAIASAKGSGNRIPQAKFKQIAANSMTEAEEYIAGRVIEFSDQQWHLESAKQEFEDGLYGAAIYDSAYALYMAKGFEDFPRSTNAKEVLESAKNAEYKSIWANIYKSQMEYILATGDGGRVSLQLLEFADGLENKTHEMAVAFGGEENGFTVPEPPGINVTNSAANYVIILLIILTLLAIILVFKQAMEE
ncbi:MAG: S16 family serine protease [Candidatus Micrarchaeota archaeon]